MSERVRIDLLFALLCFTWGSTWIAIKYGLLGMAPSTGAAVRFALSALVLLALAYFLRMPLPRSRGYVGLVLLQGVTQFGINFALVYWAEKTVPSGLAAVVFSIAPLITSAFAAIALPAERLNAINILGLVFGIAGVAVVYWSEVVAAGHASPLGIGAVLLAAVVVSVSSVVTKRFGHGVAPLALAGPGQAVGAIFLALVALATERGQPIVLDTPVILATLYLGTVGSLAFLAYFYLLRAIPVTRLSLITYVTPVVAVSLGALMLHEQLAPRTFIGAALIFAGVALMYRRTQTVSPECVEPLPGAPPLGSAAK